MTTARLPAYDIAEAVKKMVTTDLTTSERVRELGKFAEAVLLTKDAYVDITLDDFMLISHAYEP